jgi:hypothetical protein
VKDAAEPVPAGANHYLIARLLCQDFVEATMSGSTPKKLNCALIAWAALAAILLYSIFLRRPIRDVGESQNDGANLPSPASNGQKKPTYDLREMYALLPNATGYALGLVDDADGVYYRWKGIELPLMPLAYMGIPLALLKDYTTSDVDPPITYRRVENKLQVGCLAMSSRTFWRFQGQCLEKNEVLESSPQIPQDFLQADGSTYSVIDIPLSEYLARNQSLWRKAPKKSDGR